MSLWLALQPLAIEQSALVKHLDRSVHEVIEGHPSEIAALLQRGEVDLVCSSGCGVSGPSLRVNGGIGAEGPVDSVFLVAETPPERWTSVALDGVSRTSVVLSQLLLDGPYRLGVTGSIRKRCHRPKGSNEREVRPQRW